MSIRYRWLLLGLLLLVNRLELPAQQTVASEQLTGLQLSYPGDASASVWNPSLLGVKSATDEILLSLPYSRTLVPGGGSYGLFARYGSFGLGAMTTPRDSLGQLTGVYASYGWPAVPGRFWLGGGIRLFNERGIIKSGGVTLAATIHPALKLIASLTLTNPTSTNDQDPALSLNMAYQLWDWLTLLANGRYDSADSLSGQPILKARIGFGASPTAGIHLNAHYDITGKAFQLGGEFRFGGAAAGAVGTFPTSDGFDGGQAFLRYTYSNEDPYHYDNSPFTARARPLSRGWAPSRAYFPAGLEYRGQTTDAEVSPESYIAPCDSGSRNVLNSPSNLLHAIAGAGGPFTSFARLLHRIAPDSAGLYSSIRSHFYSPRIPRGKLYRSDSLPLYSRWGYSIGVQSIDYSSYPRVSVVMQVADSAGRNVRGLAPRDFAFRDTSMKILSVDPVDSRLTVPVDIVMLIDCSASMVQKIAAVRANVETFLRNVEWRGADYRIGGVLYGSMIYDTLHPTADFASFRSFIAGASAIGSDEISSLAVKAATEMNFRPDAQRVIILITDDWGVQENSRLDETDLTQLLWKSGARLYSIITPCKNNSAVMTRLSLGGEYDIEKPFNAILDQIGSDITTVYRLVYQAPPGDTLALEPAESMATIIGTITDENGRGIQTDVRIEDARTLAKVGTAHSDSTGQYQIDIPGRGVYRITAVRPDFIPTPVEIDASQIGRGAMLLQELHITSIDAAIANGTTFTLRNIFFDYDKADLKPESLPELGKLATLLEEYPTVKVEIGAHTDALGSDEYNQTLSESRAQAVMGFLVGKGISPDRVIAKGYGRSRPVAPNGTDEGRALNRRVEFRLFK